MASKKGKEKDKAKKDSLEEKLKAENNTLAHIKQDLEVELAILTDKLRQGKAQNQQLVEEIDRLKIRLASATKDYADILDHREEQIKIGEIKISQLNEQVESFQTEVTKCNEEIDRLKDQNSQQAIKLEDAQGLLLDRGNLEDTVRRQHDLIEKQAQELKMAQVKLQDFESALEKARGNIEELKLKSSWHTELKVLFEAPWLVQVSHTRLKGVLPLDKEGNTLACLTGGKHLIYYGGVNKNQEPTSQVAVLNMETLMWDTPSIAEGPGGASGHSATVVGRTRMMVFGGLRQGGQPEAAVSVLNTDTMRWHMPQVRGVNQPQARYEHCSTCLRDRLIVFGGVNSDQHLMNDLWVLDQDSLQWNRLIGYGVEPPPLKGASLCASEDGRRLYLFGGYDGSQHLNDVFCLDMERMTWSTVTCSGDPPEPREGHTVLMIGKYMLITGGWGGPSQKHLMDTFVLDLMIGPTWECLDDGSWGSAMMWLKQRSTYTTFLGNKMFTVKPNLQEQLDELQITEFVLPENIERMRAAKKKDVDVADKLEVMDNAICGSNFIEISWRPPTKNADRVSSYKLMMATNTGVVKEIYRGKMQHFKAGDLKPRMEYVFCVKAIYEDGSFLWSQSKPFCTRA